MVDDFVRADDALVDQVLDLRMVLGRADEPALPEQVEPGVADVTPVRVAGLHDAGDTGGARGLQHRELRRVGPERRVRLHHRLVEEGERILEDGRRLLLEPLDEQPHRDLRGDLAARVPAHAVGHDEETPARGEDRWIVRLEGAEGILVPRADPADVREIGKRDGRCPTGRTHQSRRNRASLVSTERMSVRTGGGA
jgi:hypothetical protein